MDTAKTTPQLRWAARRDDLARRIAAAPRALAGTLACLALVLASVGGLFVAKAALASSGASSSPLVGLWVNGTVSASSLGVTQQVWSDYAYGSDYCSYTSSPPVPAGGTLMLAVGACTEAQAAAMGKQLVSAGQSHAIIRVMWENNQNLDGWFQSWNQLAFPTAASFDAAFDTVVAGFRSVAGSDFQMMYNPNGGDTNSAPGLTWQSEYPGNSEVNMIGVDMYDFPGYAADIQAVATFAQGQGIPAAIPEWGLNGSDDPAYINSVAGIVNNPANDFALEAYFSYDGSINSDITEFPQSEAAFKADFDGTGTSVVIPPTTTASPTTTKPPVPPTTAPKVSTTTAPKVTTTTASPTTTRAPAPPTTVAPTTTTTAARVTQTTTSTPVAPTGVTASVSGSTVTVSWTNGKSTMGDDVFRDGQEIAWPGWPLPVVTSYQDTGVPAGSHTYYVAAYNSAGVGTASRSVTVSVGGGHSSGGTGHASHRTTSRHNRHG